MKMPVLTMCIVALLGCSSHNKGNSSQSSETEDNRPAVLCAQANAFSADSAYKAIETQVNFGPRVPGTGAHTQCAAWLAEVLRGRGAEVTVQKASLKAFDGTTLPAHNILACYNPQASDRTLLVAHWDTRPWADQDPEQSHHSTPVPGANDGASGVGVLLEIARVLEKYPPQTGVDILLVDAEDYGTEGDDLSWALGARHFVQNPPLPGYRPARVILLDMVGGSGAVFRREQFSEAYARPLLDEVWAAAARAGHSSRFSHETGGAITDDHVEFIRTGIPAIDIIAFDPQGGFPATWHTLADDMQDIDPATLQAVGQSLLTYLYTNK